MPACGYGEPAAEAFHESMRDELDRLFGEEEECDMFDGVDFTRFDIDDLDLSVFESSYDSEDDSDGECLNSKFRNHDCMWGGLCCKDKDNQRTQVPVLPPPRKLTQAPTFTPTPSSTTLPPPVLITHSSLHKVVTIQKCLPNRTNSAMVVRTNSVPPSEGRSLLLNRTNSGAAPHSSPAKQAIPQAQFVKREPPTPQSSRPETPQSLAGSDPDDDISPIHIDPHNNGIIRSAIDHLTTVPVGDWDDSLFDFSARRTKPERPVGPTPSQTELLRLSATAKSDHCYDGSSKGMRLEGLGVETPSDSEEDEEIDVVSFSERGGSSACSRSSSCSSGGLPTRPTAEALEEITTSLLFASEAVSRKLKKAITTQSELELYQYQRHKRKKYESDSSDVDPDDDYEDEEEVEEEYDEPVQQAYHRRQTKRPRASLPQLERRKKMSRLEGEDGWKKRDLHNNMERMRRIDLRICFDELKSKVPTVANKERAAKVVILREAAVYCCELQAESQSKQLQVQALRREQHRLRSMVSSLRKAAAMACVKAQAQAQPQPQPPKRCYI